jgi:gliding motility-associated-like protein
VVGGTIVSWTWTFGDGSPTSSSQNPMHCYTQTGYYDVTLAVTTSQGCAATLTKHRYIQVFANPIAAFDPSPNPASVLDASITMYNQSSSDVNYWYWNFGDGTNLSPSTISPEHLFPHVVAGNYTVTLIVHNADGCYDTVAHEIVIQPEFAFFIPNAFTPNGDGINDYFYGSGVGIVTYDLWIFDRWGNMIFHGLNLSDKWNGKANNGSDMAQIDTYVWKVKLMDIFNKTHDYIGTVTLVK